MTCDYKPAKLNKRVSLQTVTQADDGQGGFLPETWEDEAELWAQIEPAKGWERPYAGQVRTPVTHKVLLRYRAGVTTAKRLLFQGRVFEIKEVINLEEANRFLRLSCIETT